MVKNFIKYALFLCLFFFSCNKKEDPDLNKKYMSRYYPYLLNKKISFNTSNYFRANKFKNNKHKTKFTIIKLINTGCTHCFLEMEDWKKFIEDDKLPNNIEVKFLAIGELNSYFKGVVNDYNYPFEIWSDTTDIFFAKNHYIHNPLETLWLNSYDSIILAGSPVKNKLLLKLISKIK